jgi:ferritin-like metal-binding protein YciE
MSTLDDHLMAWLRDAHAMEEQAETILKGQASRIEHYPHLRTRIQQHVAETQEQARRLRACIERRGGDTSTIKDAAGKLVAMGQNISGMFADDEVVKGSLASYTFEQMEIASYKILIVAAEAAGDLETKRVCETNLAEEEAMAKWLDAEMPGIVTKFLKRDEIPDVTAKR